MNEKLKIEPAVVYERKGQYFPDEIMMTDYVINDNGLNSYVYPKKLKKVSKNLVDDKTDVWYEYVPDRLADPRERAMMISLHGGLMEGWKQAVSSSWIKIADREGFIAVFPDAGTRKMWTIDYDRSIESELTRPNDTGVYMNIAPTDISDNRDANMLLGLIDFMVEKYGINRSKIYIHGMSMGDMMASMMVRYYGGRFAGAALSGALASPAVLYDKKRKIINSGGYISVFQTHMELDDQFPGGTDSIDEMVEANRNYWIKLNQCRPIPRISIMGDNNIAYYEGKKDYVYREVKGRDHGQTLDEAELVWNNLFSTDCGHTENCLRNGDSVSIAFSENCANAFVDGKIEKLSANVICRNGYLHYDRTGSVRKRCLMAPAKDLCQIFHIDIREEDGSVIVLKLPDGRTAQFASGNISCLINNRIHTMDMEAVTEKGILYLSVGWFCRTLLHREYTECRETCYITDHYARLSGGMAYLIKNLLETTVSE